MRRLIARSALLPAAALLLLAMAGCGGSAVSQPAGSTKVTLSDFKLDPNSISVTSGKVVIYLVNTGSSSHDLVITKDEAGITVLFKSALVAAGDAAVFTIDNLAAGSYFVRCDVAGHAESGMKGTLTAK